MGGQQSSGGTLGQSAAGDLSHDSTIYPRQGQGGLGGGGLGDLLGALHPDTMRHLSMLNAAQSKGAQGRSAADLPTAASSSGLGMPGGGVVGGAAPTMSASVESTAPPASPSGGGDLSSMLQSMPQMQSLLSGLGLL